MVAVLDKFSRLIFPNLRGSVSLPSSNSFTTPHVFEPGAIRPCDIFINAGLTPVVIA